MKTAVGYIRVSSASQASPEKTSLERQTVKIKLQARLKEYELAKIYEEPGVSGATMDRPALQELMVDAEAHKFEAVIVWDISRFGRNLLHLKQNTERLKELGIAFLAIDNGIDTSNRDKTGELLLNILASIYEFELETIKTRVLGGRLLKWQRGEIPMGEIPYGYRWNPQEKRYEHCPEEFSNPRQRLWYFGN
jgi:site-specific DNA recombinase